MTSASPVLGRGFCVGRRKKENSVKRTYRMSLLVLKMVELYADDRSMDNTTALNNLAHEYLSSMGYRQKAEDELREEADRPTTDGEGVE